MPVARMMISIPEDLKARMDAVKDRPNWSAVASRAFEKELAEIASRKKEQTMDEIMQRFRAEALEMEDEGYKEGHAAGRDWALHRATLKDLRAIKKANIDSDEGWDGEPDAYGWGRCIVEAIMGEGEFSRKDIEAFCKDEMGNAYPDADVVRGFVAGAMAAYDEIKAKM